MVKNEFVSLVKERGGVTAVAKQTGFTRVTIYKWMRDNGVKHRMTRELLFARGVNPETLETTS